VQVSAGIFLAIRETRFPLKVLIHNLYYKIRFNRETLPEGMDISHIDVNFRFLEVFDQNHLSTNPLKLMILS
ncbi:MAG: hypothetical protein EZS28_048902, partial [Streblomastix strix]